jgi:hypothetical protein
MPDPNYRDALQELHTSIQLYTGLNPEAAGIPANDLVGRLMAALAASAAALAQPEPEWVGEEELLRTYGLAKRDYCYDGPSDDWPKRAERAATVHGLRAVLTRYARPTAQPVAVSERPILKSSSFNNADGYCWCGSSDFIDETGDYSASYPASWELREPCSQDDCVLPHWAMPVPGSEGVAAVTHRSPDAYWEQHTQATEASGPGGPTWNRSYLKELERRGLTLARVRHPHDCDAWYPHGEPMWAPLPYPEGDFTWPPGTLIVWAPPAPQQEAP